MMTDTIYQRLTAMSNVLTEAQVRTMKDLESCGENAGFGMSLESGDLISFPVKDKCLFQSQTWKKNKLLKTGVSLNGNAEFVPVWLFRKRPASKKDLSLKLQGHALYQSLTRQGQKDIDRVLVLAGKTWKVSVEPLTLINDKGEEYTFEVYLLDEVQQTQPARRGRRTANNA
jgi:hypothetical protein